MNIYRLIKHTHKDRLALYDIQVWSWKDEKWYTVFPNDNQDKVIAYCERHNITLPKIEVCLFIGHTS